MNSTFRPPTMGQGAPAPFFGSFAGPMGGATPFRIANNPYNTSERHVSFNFNNNNNNNGNTSNRRSNNSNPKDRGNSGRFNTNSNDGNFSRRNVISSFNRIENSIVRYDFAMYPKNDSQELIDYINSKIGQDDNIVTINENQNQNYLYLRLKCPKAIEEKLLDLTGTPLSDDTNFYFSNISKNEEKLSTQINLRFATELMEGSRLNLSNLSDRFGIPPLNSYTVSFILFLCAIKAFSERCEIKEINFENNAQTDTKGFNYVLQLFPDLEKVYYLGNPLSNRNQYVLRPFTTPQGSARPNIELVTKEPATPSSVKTGWGNLAYQQVTTPYQIPLRRVIKGNRILSKRPKLVLQNFIPVSINPNDSPIHSFLLAFIDRGWKSLNNIHEFYYEKAVFSLTADICPVGSPLDKNFHKTGINRDFLANSPGKIAVGSREIANCQFEIFGGGFYATITSFNINIINESLCAIVFHGAFYKGNNEIEDIFSFDRSLLVGCENERIFITNDNIFVRVPKLPGML